MVVPVEIVQMQQQTYGNFTKAEYEFLEKLRGMVKNDERIDYNQLRVNPPTDNKGAFWFSFAEILSQLPDNQQLDLRENGRLQVALTVLNEMLKYNPQFAQIWATKIIVLKYLVHGYSAMANAMVAIDKQSAQAYQQQFDGYLQEFYTTIKETESRFPNDEWFAYEKAEMQHEFPSN